MADGSYTVTDQEEDTDINTANGRVVRGFRVYYNDTVTGTPGSVFVPLTGYTVDNVDAAIMHVLNRVRAVHALGR